MDAENALGRAVRLMAQDRHGEALREYESAWRAAPRDERGRCGMALVFMIMNRPGEVVKCIDDVAGLRPEDAYLSGVAGMALEEMGFEDEALACYERMSSDEPSEAASYVRRAMILLERGDRDGCAGALRECATASLSPMYPRESKRLRRILGSAGGAPRFRYRDGAVFLPGLRGLLDRAVGPEPPDPGPGAEPDTEAAIVAGAWDPGAMFEMLDEILAEYPDSARTWILKGMMLEDEGRLDEAAGCYDRAIEEEPGEMLAHIHKALLLYDEGDAAGGDECVRFALRQKPVDGNDVRMRRDLRGWGKGGLAGHACFSAATQLIAWAAARRAGRAPLGGQAGWPGDGPSLFPPGLVDEPDARGAGRGGVRAGRRR